MGRRGEMTWTYIEEELKGYRTRGTLDRWSYDCWGKQLVAGEVRNWMSRFKFPITAFIGSVSEDLSTFYQIQSGELRLRHPQSRKGLPLPSFLRHRDVCRKGA